MTLLVEIVPEKLQVLTSSRRLLEAPGPAAATSAWRGASGQARKQGLRSLFFRLGNLFPHGSGIKEAGEAQLSVFPRSRSLSQNSVGGLPCLLLSEDRRNPATRLAAAPLLNISCGEPRFKCAV